VYRGGASQWELNRLEQCSLLGGCWFKLNTSTLVAPARLGRAGKNLPTTSRYNLYLPAGKLTSRFQTVKHPTFRIRIRLFCDI
jgi:hypothetical protein